MDLLELSLDILRDLSVALSAAVGVISVYLATLAVATWRAPKRIPLAGAPTSRFAILIPAHNEERLLPRTLAAVAALDYPAERYGVHVVADRCSDRTAAIARGAGAIVHERNEDHGQGKGPALRWLIRRLQSDQLDFDAAVILDADSIIAPDFLRVMDARLSRGERAIQGFYGVQEPGQSAHAALRTVALSALHYVRPLGRSLFGGSAGLKGNGMVIARELLQRFEWTGALAEDAEYTLRLVCAGIRVTFAPDAIVRAEMPHTSAQASSQHTRWESGRLAVLRCYAPALVRSWLARPSALVCDALIDLLLPPTSVLLVMTGTALAFAATTASHFGMALAGASIVAELLYLVTSLAHCESRSACLRLLPPFPYLVFWKFALYVKVLLSPAPESWVRTSRGPAAGYPTDPAWRPEPSFPGLVAP